MLSAEELDHHRTHQVNKDYEHPDLPGVGLGEVPEWVGNFWSWNHEHHVETEECR